MRLARILTDSPDGAALIADRLRAQGYTVEFASLDEAGNARADLEIAIEHCAPGEVLERAAQMADAAAAQVFVSPGIVQPVPEAAPEAPPQPARAPQPLPDDDDFVIPVEDEDRRSPARPLVREAVGNLAALAGDALAGTRQVLGQGARDARARSAQFAARAAEAADVLAEAGKRSLAEWNQQLRERRERTRAERERAREEQQRRREEAAAPVRRSGWAEYAFVPARRAGGTRWALPFTAGAAVATVVMLIAMFVADNRAPVGATPPGDSTVEQQVPFGPVRIVPNAPAASRPAIMRPAQVQPQTQSQPPKPAAKAKPQRVAPDVEDDDVADDVVVRHNAQPVRPKPRSTGELTQVKRYSDLN